MKLQIKKTFKKFNFSHLIKNTEVLLLANIKHIAKFQLVMKTNK